MNNPKALQCPTCGSGSTTKRLDGSYDCNYCHSTFVVEEQHQEVPFTKVNFESYGLQNQGNPILLRKVLFFVFGLVFLVGIAVSISIWTVASKGQSGLLSSEFSSWQEESIYAYKALSGSQGSVIWLITTQQGK